MVSNNHCIYLCHHCQYCKYCQRLMSSQEISGDTMRSLEIPWDPMSSLDIPWDLLKSMRSLEAPLVFSRSYKIFWDPPRYLEYFWDLLKYHEISFAKIVKICKMSRVQLLDSFLFSWPQIFVSWYSVEFQCRRWEVLSVRFVK